MKFRGVDWPINPFALVYALLANKHKNNFEKDFAKAKFDAQE